MAKSSGSLKVLLWIGVVLNLLWFLLFCFGTASILAKLTLSEAPSYFMRLYGVFPLSWVILLFLALRDVEKNIAIVNGAIITAILTAISVLAFGSTLKALSTFSWISMVILVVYALLLLFFKPSIKKA
jgi:hypothetical protein